MFQDIKSIHLSSTGQLLSISSAATVNNMTSSGPSQEDISCSHSFSVDTRAHFEDEKMAALEAFTKMINLLSESPSEENAGHLKKLSSKMSKIVTAGQAVNAVVGMTSVVAKRMRSGGILYSLL